MACATEHCRDRNHFCSTKISTSSLNVGTFNGLDWDNDKRDANRAKHELDFKDVASLAWETAQVLVDDRRDYGEARYRAYAFWNDRLYFVALTHHGDKVRLISFRKANDKEVRRYGQEA